MRYLGCVVAPGEGGRGAGTRAYVVSGSISVVDTATLTVLSTVSAGLAPVSVVSSPDGTQVHVVSELSGQVSSIDTATLSVDTVTIGDLPYSIAITPDGSRAYVGIVAHIVQSGQVTFPAPLSLIKVIDLSTLSELETITLSGTPSVIAMHPSGAKLFVSIPTTDELVVVDTQTNTQVASMLVGDSPTGVAIGRPGRVVVNR